MQQRTGYSPLPLCRHVEPLARTLKHLRTSYKKKEQGYS